MKNKEKLQENEGKNSETPCLLQTIETKKCTYSGQLKNGLYHGKGKLKTPEYTYFGWFYQNKFSGYGKIIYSDGSSYDGIWKNGKYHDHGVLKEADGSVYIGEFENGLKSGNG